MTMTVPLTTKYLEVFYFSTKWFTCVPNFKFARHPQQVFLAINTTFLTNIQGNHFSHNIFAVFCHLELKFSNLDQSWAKTRLLLFKTLEVSNCMDERRKWNKGKRKNILNIPFTATHHCPPCNSIDHLQLHLL